MPAYIYYKDERGAASAAPRTGVSAASPGSFPHLESVQVDGEANRGTSRYWRRRQTPLSLERRAPTRKGFRMTGGDDDYGGAFKKAKLEHDQKREGPTEAKRLQAEADADIAVLSDVVLPELQAASQKLEPLGGKVEIRQYGRTGKTLRPASVAFRITDQQDRQDQPGQE